MINQFDLTGLHPTHAEKISFSRIRKTFIKIFWTMNHCNTFKRLTIEQCMFYEYCWIKLELSEEEITRIYPHLWKWIRTLVTNLCGNKKPITRALENILNFEFWIWKYNRSKCRGCSQGNNLKKGNSHVIVLESMDALQGQNVRHYVPSDTFLKQFRGQASWENIPQVPFVGKISIISHLFHGEDHCLTFGWVFYLTFPLSY